MNIRNLLLKLGDGVKREDYDSIVSDSLRVMDEYNSLLDTLKKKQDKNKLEKEIINKYPSVEKLYGARPLPPEGSRILIDPRVFFTPYDSKILKICKKISNNGTDDDKIYQAFKWVRSNIKYKYDKDNFGSVEYWSFPFETLIKEFGDCDSQSILLANLCLVAGVPYYKLRLTVGPVKGGNHCFLTYYVESKEKWVIMDSTYWPNALKPNQRKDYKDEDHYFKEIWFSFDQKNIYQKGHKNWIK